MSSPQSLRFAPMNEADLDWVVAQENLLYAFPWTRGNFADSLASAHRAWMLFDDNQPVGYVVLMTVVDEAHLLNIAIAPDRQGAGLGRYLLEFALDDVRSVGANQLFLEVRPSNSAALALYQRLGGTEIGRRKAYYPAATGREDAVVMRLAL